VAGVSRPTSLLSAAPAALPALLATLIFSVWATSEAGYLTADWYPGALFLVALLAVTAGAVPLRLADVPRPVLAALACLAAYTAWSFLSLLWADDGGEAWDGANRTLLYLVVFALFALWPMRGQAALLPMCAWILGITIVAAVTLLQVNGARFPLDHYLAQRLADPSSYVNANSALFLLPAWPAVLLSGRREVAWWLRSALAGCATILAGVALMGQSRGSVFAVPIVLVVVFLALPDRVRNFAALLPLAAALAAIGPVVLHSSDLIDAGKSATGAVAPLAPTILGCALAVALVVALIAVLERRVATPERERAAHRALAAVGIALALAGGAAGLVLAGGPVEGVRDGWHSFKQGYSNEQGGRLFTSGLGSNRYDFYRVSLDVFLDHPVAGVGADNFAQDYLAARRSDESPRYPHSLEMRALAETGIVGALLLLGAIAAALWAALRAARQPDRLAAGVAAAATVSFVYWLVHGSVDWFWEFAGLGAPAWAMIGLACGLLPRRAVRAVATEPEPPGRFPIGAIAVGAFALVAAISLALPWIAETQTRRAARTWPQDLQLAHDRLDQAASMNPFSERPLLVAGTIALRRHDLAGAEKEFRQALDRNRRSSYAALELGAIASQRGERALALGLLRRAQALNPRDDLTRTTLRAVLKGRRIDVERLNRRIRERAGRIR
jgi:tetratricopeptide (TPR) repeat protein